MSVYFFAQLQIMEVILFYVKKGICLEKCMKRNLTAPYLPQINDLYEWYIQIKKQNLHLFTVEN